MANSSLTCPGLTHGHLDKSLRLHVDMSGRTLIKVVVVGNMYVGRVMLIFLFEQKYGCI